MNATLSLNRSVKSRSQVKETSAKSTTKREQLLRYTYSLSQVRSDSKLKYFSIQGIVPQSDPCALEYSKITQSCFELIKKLINSAENHPQLKHLQVLSDLKIEALLAAPTNRMKNAFAHHSDDRKDIAFSTELILALYKDTPPRQAFEQFFAVLLHEACHHAWSLQCQKQGTNNLSANSKLQEEFCDLQVQVMFMLGMRPSAGADGLKKLSEHAANSSTNPFSAYLTDKSRIGLIESLATTLQPLSAADGQNSQQTLLHSEVSELSSAMNNFVQGAVSKITVVNHIDDYFEKSGFKQADLRQQIKIINNLFGQIHDLSGSEYALIYSHLESLKTVPQSIAADDSDLVRLTKNLLSHDGSENNYLQIKKVLFNSVINPANKALNEIDIGVILTHTNFIKELLGAKNSEQIFAINREFYETKGIDFLLQNSSIIQAKFNSIYKKSCSDLQTKLLDGQSVDLIYAVLLRSLKLEFEKKEAIMGERLNPYQISSELTQLNYATGFIWKFVDDRDDRGRKETPAAVELCRDLCPLIPRLEELFSKDYASIIPTEIIRIMPVSDDPAEFELCLRQERKYFASFRTAVDEALEELSDFKNSDPHEFIRFFKGDFKKIYADLIIPHPSFLTAEERKKLDPTIELAQAITDKINTLINVHPEDARSLANLLNFVEYGSYSSELQKNMRINEEICIRNKFADIPLDHPYIIFHKQQLTDKSPLIDPQESALNLSRILCITSSSKINLFKILELDLDNIFNACLASPDFETFSAGLPRFNRKYESISTLLDGNPVSPKDSLLEARSELIEKYLEQHPDLKISIKSCMDLVSMSAKDSVKADLMQRIDFEQILKQELPLLIESFRKLSAMGYFQNFPDKIDFVEERIIEALNSKETNNSDNNISVRLITPETYYCGDSILRLGNRLSYNIADPIRYQPGVLSKDLESKIVSYAVADLSGRLQQQQAKITDQSYTDGNKIDIQLHDFIKARFSEFKDIPFRYKKMIFEEFAEAICAQRETAYLIKELLTDKSELRQLEPALLNAKTEQINIVGSVIEDLHRIFRNDKELCKSYIDFFSSPLNKQKLDILVQHALRHHSNLSEIFSKINGSDSGNSSMLNHFPDEYKKNLKDLQLRRLFSLTHERLSYASYEQRAVFLRVASVAESGRSEDFQLKEFFKLVQDRLIDPNHTHAQLTKDFLTAYIGQGWDNNMNQSALILCGFLGSKLDQSKDTGGPAELGHRIAKFLLNHGEAGRKICQRIHSVPGLDPEFTAAFSHTKEDSIKMTRWDLFDLIDAYGPGDLQEVHIGKARFASLNASVPLKYQDGQHSMLSVLMPGARMRAVSWLNNFEAVIDVLAKDYPTLDYLKPVISEARETIFEETDYEKTVFKQQQIADKQIDGTVISFPEATVRFETAKLIRAAATSKGTADTDSGYRECSFCEGLSFNELKQDIKKRHSLAISSGNRAEIRKIKSEIDQLRIIAMSNITQVIRDIVAGGHLDSDSHGGQQKIIISHNQVKIGRFDFGCMSTKIPSEQEQNVAASCIVETINKTVPQIAKNILRFKGPRSGQTLLEEFAKSIASRTNDRAYISRIQTALAALGDFTYIDLEKSGKSAHRVQLINARQLASCIEAAIVIAPKTALADKIRKAVKADLTAKAVVSFAKFLA